MATKKISELEPVFGVMPRNTDLELCVYGANSDGGPAPMRGTAAKIAASNVSPEPTTSRTLSIDDIGQYTRWTGMGAKTLTVPENPGVDSDGGDGFYLGAEFHGRVVNGDPLMISPGASDVIIHAPAGGSLSVPAGGTYTLKVVDDNEYDLIGVTEVET